ncbi:MAG: hypothetical protein PHY40_02265 [Patescibacteria group bacterium]|nr:hypothetical protein [Patescibacteria group bacterium]
MNKRQEEILKFAIEKYIESGEPIGSRFLVSKTGLKWSEATVRNELRVLEKSGYLGHPHTSAGRVPTEKGYRYYVERILKPIEIKKKIRETLFEIIKADLEISKKIKTLGQYVSNITGAASIVSLGDNDIYFTGISKLFSQPEFRDLEKIADVSDVFDHCEEYIQDMHDLIGDMNKTHVLIGKNNPLDEMCSVVASGFENNGLFILVGPTRMNYRDNISLINYISNLM